jgi:hypothetical protein
MGVSVGLRMTLSEKGLPGLSNGWCTAYSMLPMMCVLCGSVDDATDCARGLSPAALRPGGHRDSSQAGLYARGR